MTEDATEQHAPGEHADMQKHILAVWHDPAALGQYSQSLSTWSRLQNRTLLHQTAEMKESKAWASVINVVKR